MFWTARVEIVGSGRGAECTRKSSFRAAWRMIPAVAKCFMITLMFVGNYAWSIQAVGPTQLCALDRWL